MISLPNTITSIKTRKYLLHGYLLCVPAHTTAWDQHLGDDEILKKVTYFSLIVCDDSGVIQRTSSRSSLAGSEVSSSSNATHNLDLAFVQGMQASFSKPLMTNSEAEATPAPFPG